MSDLSNRLKGSLLLFTKFFYKLRTGREFDVCEPIGREPHFITMSKALTKTVRGETNRLMINVPPRYGKTELLIHYVAWCMAKYPDSNFIYVSYAHKLAAKQTQTIRQIMSMPEYKQLFGVEITKESSAKDNFETTAGGSVYAVGAGGTITGRGAGIQGIERFGGAIIIDDIHKPSEVTSDTMRNSIKEWYPNTLVPSRLNNPSKTPVIFIGQRLHEDDLPGQLIQSDNEQKWERVILKSIDEAGNALNPSMHTKDQLLEMQETMPYEFAAQYQQNPQPAGGGIFKPEWFRLLDFEPNILETFITADTAETSKTHNDATVFSFWGVYEIEQFGEPSGLYGLHWIDCHECWVEPKDLQSEFMSFYRNCMRHRVKPKMAAIEKKSTGTTLVSILSGVQGIHIFDIERTRESGSKTQRFLEIQAYIASHQVTLPIYGKHTAKCIEHMRKITANDTHRYDDIADTCADAVKLALIDKVLLNINNTEDPKAEKFIATMNRAAHSRRARFASWQDS